MCINSKNKIRYSIENPVSGSPRIEEGAMWVKYRRTVCNNGPWLTFSL